MMSGLFLGRDAFIDFSVHVTGITLIIPALFWLYFGKRGWAVRSSSGKENSTIFFWLIIIPLGVLVAPFTSSLIQKLIGTQPYINTMIAIPTAMTAVYAFMDLTEILRLNGRKKTGAVICFALLVFTGSSVFMTYDHPLGFELLSDSMKISPEVREICDHIGSEYTLLPEEIYGQVHEYDSGVDAGILNSMTNDYNYAVNTAKTATNAQAPCFVIKKTYDDPEVMETYFYTRIAETDHYVIYQLSEEQ